MAYYHTWYQAVPLVQPIGEILYMVSSSPISTTTRRNIIHGIKQSQLVQPIGEILFLI